MCDSREMPVMYMRSDESKEVDHGVASGENRKAAISLEGTYSNRDAIGAHIELLPDPDANTGDAEHSSRHTWVHSANGFQSQNSKWIMLPLGASLERDVKITWPRGSVSQHTIAAWSRTVLNEPEQAGSHRDQPMLRSRLPAPHVADHVLAGENRRLKKQLYDSQMKHSDLR